MNEEAATQMLKALALARRAAEDAGDSELISLTERALIDAHMRLIQMRGEP